MAKIKKVKKEGTNKTSQKGKLKGVRIKLGGANTGEERGRYEMSKNSQLRGEGVTRYLGGGKHRKGKNQEGIKHHWGFQRL